MVLQRGSMELDTNLKIQRRLEELYGADLSASIDKRGETHVLRFTMESVNNKYIDKKDYILEVVDLLKAVIFKPLIDNSSFKKEYVDQEKENLRRRIEGRINNKRAYAIDRCIEEMFEKGKYSIFPLGRLEDLDGINESNLYNHYKNILETSPIEIFLVGDFSDKDIDYIKGTIDLERDRVISFERESLFKSSQSKKMIMDDLNVNQGKLVLGYETGIAYDDKLFNGLIVGNEIFGGGPNSKLFNNVREKESLAYSISSIVYKYKGIMLVDSGIEFQNYSKTLGIIKEELNKMIEGNFSDNDIYIAKKSIKASIVSINDSIFRISEYFFNKVLSKDLRDLDQIMADIDIVTKEDIINAMGKMKLDTIYFMKNPSIDMESIKEG